MMTQADFKPLLKHGKVFVLDVRDQKDFDEGHIPWAKHIPLKQLAERMQELPTNKPIIAVCGKGGGRSAEAAEMIPGADWLEGGTNAYFGE
jgi:rhodanese-related sulfurtransferase